MNTVNLILKQRNVLKKKAHYADIFKKWSLLRGRANWGGRSNQGITVSFKIVYALLTLNLVWKFRYSYFVSKLFLVQFISSFWPWVIFKGMLQNNPISPCTVLLILNLVGEFRYSYFVSKTVLVHILFSFWPRAISKVCFGLLG